MDELRIVNCKINQTAVNTLVSGLKNTRLRKLTLVKIGINGNLLDKVIEIVKSSRSLVELDISWNGITSVELRKLFEVLATNRQLQYLNISWNEISEPKLKNVSQEKEWEELKMSLKR